MADTGRGVSWSLERPCPLRTGADWAVPKVAHQQLGDVIAYARALRDRHVVDDVCVTSYTHGSDAAGNTVMIPHSGFRVALALAPFGGASAVRAACGGCEANVNPADPGAPAGCHGYLDAWPDSAELEESLRDTIRLNGLEETVERLFPATTPLWYGFWINPALDRARCELLLRLLEGDVDPNDERDADLRHFLAALRAAIQWELPLRVEMHPPGHTDFGWYTVFPHCPRCKAHAPVARWQESYPDEPLDCAVCGQHYSPAATHKTERMDEAGWDASRLENLLGAGNVEPFTRRFLAHRGCNPEQVDEVIDRENNGPLKRRINDLRRRQAEVRRALPARDPTPDPLPQVLTLELGGVALRARLIPAGEFLMGSAEADTGEGPQRRVAIARPFYMGEFPVTQAQFEAVLGTNPARFTGDSDRPVERVSWFAAQEFCLRASQLTGRWVRLPSESEWEYACRAGTTTAFHWGEAPDPEWINCKIGGLAPVAHLLADTAGSEDATQTNVAGRYPANPWGLFDTHGNVQEWCEDEWHASFAGASADGSARVTPGNEDPFRVIRGGSCWHYATACTASSRQQLRADADDEPRDVPEDSSLAALFSDKAPVGFRVVIASD